MLPWTYPNAHLHKSWINRSCSGGVIARHEYESNATIFGLLNCSQREKKSDRIRSVCMCSVSLGLWRWEVRANSLVLEGGIRVQRVMVRNNVRFTCIYFLFLMMLGYIMEHLVKRTREAIGLGFFFSLLLLIVWSNTHAFYCPHIALERWGLDCPCFNRKSCVPRRGKKERAMMAALPLGPASVCVRLPNPENRTSIYPTPGYDASVEPILVRPLFHPFPDSGAAP